jgi:ATP-dependent Clp protease ATP-binding subunit ClpB
MRMDKLTLKSQDAVSTAQDIATENNHYEIQPEHLLKALTAQEGGMFSSISQKIGASAADINS